MKWARGISLVEVLVSLSLVIIGVVSFSFSQKLLLKNEWNMVYLNQAQWQLGWILDVLRRDPHPPQSLLVLWSKQIQVLLPNGHANIFKDKQKQIITISWGGQAECVYKMKNNSHCIYYAIPS